MKNTKQDKLIEVCTRCYDKLKVFGHYELIKENTPDCGDPQACKWLEQLVIRVDAIEKGGIIDATRMDEYTESITGIGKHIDKLYNKMSSIDVVTDELCLKFERLEKTVKDLGDRSDIGQEKLHLRVKALQGESRVLTDTFKGVMKIATELADRVNEQDVKIIDIGSHNGEIYKQIGILKHSTETSFDDIDGFIAEQDKNIQTLFERMCRIETDVLSNEDPIVEGLKELNEPENPYYLDQHRLYCPGNSVIHRYGCPNSGGYHETPTVLVLHYTAGRSFEKTSELFMNPESDCSAHILIGKGGEVAQFASFSERSWSCGQSEYNGRKSVNAFSINIEFDNFGKLVVSGLESQAYCYPWFDDNYQEKVPSNNVFHQRGLHGKSFWEGYTDIQIQTGLLVVKAILDSYPSIKAIVGHEHVSPGRKVDPGPAFPMERFQALLVKNG
jgi:N-acetylmuramoyl-L-alanine amidase